MQRFILCCALSAVCIAAIAQTNKALPRTSALPESHQFDFWVGDWSASWPGGQGGTPVGKTGRGSNHVEKILSDCVIEENFENFDTGLRGMSFSVYNPAMKEWQQTWVDSQGGYLLFVGTFHDSSMELRAAPRTLPSGQKSIARMLYRNIRPDSFDWSYQHSEDEGKSWTDTWSIRYVRKN